MHLTAYRVRPEINAVIHAHPPYATAFALAHQSLETPTLPEIILTLGKIPLADYATPGTEEVGASVIHELKEHNAVLLKNHGVLTIDTNLKTACYHMERVEHFAKILFIARQLGGEKILEKAQLEKLLTLLENL